FFVIPSIFILLSLSYVYAAWGKVSAVAGMLAGFKPVVVAIVVEAVLKIGRRALARGVHYLIAGAAFIGIYFLHVPFPLIVLLAGVIGLIGTRLWPEIIATEAKAGKHAPVVDDAAPARLIRCPHAAVRCGR